jgi:aminobenzoyl-glutamate transport protein
MISGFIYGKISGNIKNSHEYSLGLSKSFENLGLVFVLMFFTSIMISILDYTNIGVVISANLVDFISSISLSGIPLIVIFMLIVIIMSFLIPDTVTKWQLLSPTVVPLFMRSNITPDFTQYIFQIADSVGKGLTPVFAYFIVMIGFMQKYVSDEEKSINVVDTLKMTLPITLIIGLVWIAILVLWFISGLPIGINGFSTL